ncbi:hypothetical protein GCM10022222_15170 [Amycolatopsis ultiminotia]|uniref:Uncharacterized protein n=1 Tax=Amycolatopsis ultiminotia TaxID=543629 RepID=A0ABP6VD00_9PSEU
MRISGASGPPAPSTVPSGNVTRTSSDFTARRNNASAALARTGECGGVASPGHRDSSGSGRGIASAGRSTLDVDKTLPPTGLPALLK